MKALNLQGTAFPLADANGNCVSFIDDAGNVQAHYTYDAFGNTVSQSGTMAAVFRFLFSSKYLDDETGLYYYGLRYYAPALGRWVSRDPIKESGGLNLFAFVGNNINLIDIFGLLDNPIIDLDVITLEDVVNMLKTMRNRPHTETYEFKDEKVSDTVQRGSGFVSCDLCPDDPNTVYPCMASGTWIRKTPRATIRLPLWLGQFDSTVTDDDRNTWSEIMNAVKDHEQGHVNINEQFLNMLNWSFSAVATSCSSYENACALAKSELEKEYNRHINGIETMHRWEQDAFQKKDVPETWKEIDEIMAGK